jgi:hypothetical protein
MAEYKPKSAKGYMPRSARPAGPEVGAAETFVNKAVGWIPGANRLVDAASAGILHAASSGGERARLTPQAKAELAAMDEEVPEEQGLVDRYREVRDERAARTEAGSEQNPWASRFGSALGIGLSALAPLPKVAGTGLKSTALTGAGYGAVGGLTDGSADLTRGEFGQAALDTLKGAGLGAGLGALGHGAMRVGQKAISGLRGARADVLAQETAAAREAAEAGQAELAKDVSAHRKLVGQARAGMSKDFAARDKVHGQALEIDKAKGAKAARGEERAQKLLERARKREAPSEDPSTKVLEGYHGKAHQAQQHRSDKALEYRRGMGEPDLDTQVASSRQDYIDRMPEALDNPPALRRNFMEKYLRRKYGDEAAERILRERVGPGGEILQRQAPAQQPALPAGDDALPMLEPLETSAAAPALLERQVLAPMPARRAGASPQAIGIDGRPGPMNMEPTPITPPARPAAPVAPDSSMVAPRDMPLPQEAVPTRSVEVPQVVRPAPPPTQPAAPQAPAPPVQAPQEPIDLTRLAGPEDVAALAGERAAAREAGGFGAVAHAGYEGVRSSGNVLGAVLGGLGGITREALRDPAVKARALSMAKLHLLAKINPDLFARVGAPLASAATRGESTYRARKYLEIRKDPALRAAEQQASEQASRMSDEQLMNLIAGAAPGG